MTAFQRLGGGAALNRVLSKFSSVRVAVVGDLMVDQFVYGNAERISPEAPVPVVTVDREVFLLGGAANVVHNLRSLGAQVEVAGVVGADPMGELLRRELEGIGVGCEGLVELEERPTALKTRVIAQHQQVVRFDRERKGAVPARTTKAMVGQLCERLPALDAIVVSDYGKGVVTRALMEGVVRAAREAGVVVSVDPKPENVSIYRGVTVMTPNVKETEAMAGVRARSDEEATSAGRRLLKRLNCRAVLVTRGERGMTLVEEDGNVGHIPTSARDVFDVTGAGDTAISALTLAWAAGAPPIEAAHLANLAAGIVVGKLGTATVTVDELRAASEDQPTPSLGRSQRRS